MANAQQSPRAQFDVVSVKPGDPSSHGQMVNTPHPGLYQARNLTLLSLVLGAYRIDQTQLIGGPNWLTSAGWDIEARFPASTTDEQRREMMQSLLAERFGLVVHRETRTLPIYKLVVAKGGAKLAEVSEENGGMSAGPRMIRYAAATMAELASQLSSYLGHQVFDATELKGHYKVDLKFAPVDTGAAADAPESGATIFTALQEQLGLKVDSTRGPVEVLVIDKAEKPQEN